MLEISIRSNHQSKLPTARLSTPARLRAKAKTAKVIAIASATKLSSNTRLCVAAADGPERNIHTTFQSNHPTTEAANRLTRRETKPTTIPRTVNLRLRKPTMVTATNKAKTNSVSGSTQMFE